MRLIRQSEVQARGGKCARFPTSCVVRDLLAEAGVLKPFKRIRILDMTFGEGRFWAAIPNAEVWGFDVRRLEWVVEPKRFFMKSCENWRKEDEVMRQRFDLVVADPPFSPYHRGWQKRNHYRARGEIALILYEARKASLYFGAPLLVHFMGRFQFWGFHIVAEAWYLGSYSLARNRFPSWFGVLAPEVGE